MFRLSVVLLVSGFAALVAFPLTLPRAAEEPDQFTEEFLNDEDNIDLGRELFRQQCIKCHGRGAYPGKAPKLKTDKMTPREIYLKMTYGFGRMPAWEDLYSDAQRRAITAYMKSNRFSN